MRLLPSLFFAAILAVGYFLFFRSQAESPRAVPAAAPKAWVAGASPNDPYKADLDRAHVAAAQMNTAKAEADGIR